jgi:hypothetical protein
MRTRLARLVRTGSPGYVWKAAKRQAIWRRHEAQVAKAAREGRPLLVGPFLGEVGYELLYWIPVVRRLLAEHGVERDRVTVLTRGGAGVWYRDCAAHEIEILDLVDPEQFLDELVARRRRVVTAKQFFPDRFDSALARMALEQIPRAAVVHPLVMYSRLRFLWEGLLPPEQAPRLADYGLLPRPSDASLPSGLPSDYVAVKLYFSEPFPDEPDSRGLAGRLLEALAERTEVVVLTSGRQLDEHREWVPAGPRIRDASPWATPRDNLAVQTAIVSRARALVSTYGGFSYLGPMLGVPTLAVYTRDAFSPIHLGVLRAAFPGSDYSVVGADGLEEALEFVRRAGEPRQIPPPREA